MLELYEIFRHGLSHQTFVSFSFFRLLLFCLLKLLVSRVKLFNDIFEVGLYYFKLVLLE